MSKLSDALLHYRMSVAPLHPEYQSWLHRVRLNGEVLMYAPQHLHTDEMYDAAIEKNGVSLRHIPVRFRTPDRSLRAVSLDHEAALYIGNPLAPQRNSGVIAFTSQRLHARVLRNGQGLRHVPAECQSAETILAALPAFSSKKSFLAAINDPDLREELGTLPWALMAEYLKALTKIEKGTHVDVPVQLPANHVQSRQYC